MRDRVWLTVEIDDELLKRAMRASGARTKREVVEQALKLMIRLAEQEKLIRGARGALHWEGDLASMRRSRRLSKSKSQSS